MTKKRLPIPILLLSFLCLQCQEKKCQELNLAEQERLFKIDSFPSSIFDVATVKMQLNKKADANDSLIRIWWVDVNHKITPVVAKLTVVQIQLNIKDFETKVYTMCWSNQSKSSEIELKISSLQMCRPTSNLKSGEILDSLQQKRFTSIFLLPDYNRGGGAMGDDVKLLQYIYGNKTEAIDFSNQISLAGERHERDVAFVNFLQFLQRTYQISLPSIL